ncbi:MAG TPA: Hpt domain-containing protein [Pirellulales bacterium]|jgi:HPt (histidine-containing phosphotransfer) domain-containing protein|nr:Hpt domain-containing protein [Pirellulales bacterium]
MSMTTKHELGASARAATSAADEMAQVLALDELLRRCMGCVPLAQRLLTSFEMRFNSEVEQIVNSLHDGDVPRLVRLTHQLKGAAGNVSALELRQVLEAMEMAAREKQLDRVVVLLPALNEEGARFAQCKVSALAALSRQAAASESTN